MKISADSVAIKIWNNSSLNEKKRVINLPTFREKYVI